jgi:hypothetical protein
MHSTRTMLCGWKKLLISSTIEPCFTYPDLTGSFDGLFRGIA